VDSPTVVEYLTDEVMAMPTVGGRYQLGEIVGRGGMSTVYAALDRSTGQRVAVKVFRAGVELADSAARRHREVELASALDHSGVVAVLDAQVDDNDRVNGCAYLVTEFVDGPTLGQRIRQAALNEHQAIELGITLSGTLAYVHAAGIIHRDIKPANILLPSGGNGLLHPKLTDFGIAFMIDSTRMTATGFMAGTANYLSPEQVLGQALTAASDVYSLGLVLLESLSGETVFPGHGIEAALARLHADPQPPAWTSPGLSELLHQMTARDPQARPTAELARRRFRRLAGEGLASDLFALDVAPLTARSSRTKLLATHRRRRGAVVTGFLAAGAVLAGLVLGPGGNSDAGTVAKTPPSPSSTTSSPITTGASSSGSSPSGATPSGPTAAGLPFDAVVPAAAADPPAAPATSASNAGIGNPRVASAPVTAQPASNGKNNNGNGQGNGGHKHAGDSGD
jgi:eukaryotic-like serine/threonine-protein kinase